MNGPLLHSARSRWALFSLLLLAVIAVVLLAKPFASPAAAESQSCGTKALYGKTLTLHIVGKGLTCAEVKKITAGDCEVDGAPWFCFAPHAPGPALFWAKDKERFSEKPSVVIEARRYPCSQANVTAADWKRARASTATTFPAEQQLLADDLIRCKQLKGKRYAAVRTFLGKPDEHTGRKELDYLLGDERDSMFQVDGEFLSVTFTSKGVVKAVEIYQG